MRMRQFGLTVREWLNLALSYLQLREKLDRLNGFAKLEPDWDSYGGKPTTPAAITAARRLIGQVFSTYAVKVALRAVPDDVGPTPNGGVEVEWRSPAMDVAVEVGPHGGYDYLIIDRRGPQRKMTEKHSVDHKEVLQVIEMVMEAEAGHR